jgi:hypothetical protein
MDESDKHKLEGLLKARSDDLRHGRRPKTRRPVSDPPPVRSEGGSEPSDAPTSGRRCADCGEDIAPRRLRAMPRATLCLGCQRVAEAAEAHS